MNHHADPLASLVSGRVAALAERINMPYLGYHFLRETLTSRLLGESEAPILYWMGKDIGRQLPIQSAAGLVLPFIRLGLGKLEVLEERVDRIVYTLRHSIYDCVPQERLECSLSLECGIAAGAVACWRNRDADGRLAIRKSADSTGTEAVITVTV